MIWLNSLAITYRDSYIVTLVDYKNVPTQAFAPIFPNRYAADVFVFSLYDFPHVSHATETPEAEMKLAEEIGKFIAAFDEKYDGADAPYPTPDGAYPKPKVMARMFVEARAQVQEGQVAA